MKNQKNFKEKIYKFLIENRGNKFFLKEASIKSNISYPTFQKWIYVLIEEKRNPPVLIEDKGRTKFVWVK